MSMKPFIVLLSLIWFSVKSFGQAPVTEYFREYFITLNGNQYLPIQNPEKGRYPVLWYDKETDPKLLIGGFGAGVSAFRPLKEKVSLKAQANLSKQTYWGEPVRLVDEVSLPTGDFLAGSSDYAVGITALAHYFFKEKLSVGTGLGGQILLVSLSRVPEFRDEIPVVRNRYYRPFMPVLPVELSFKSQKHLFNIRYEHGLLNRYKRDLGAYKKDRFGLLSFEVGFKVN